MVFIDAKSRAGEAFARRGARDLATAIAAAHVAIELVCRALYPRRRQSQP
ncbi:MAG: hypothetical protein JKX69_08090 [Rhodobacteraceae bacterium]|nr:hypothetical protein [Paracoccaceae bacterium]